MVALFLAISALVIRTKSERRASVYSNRHREVSMPPNRVLLLLSLLLLTACAMNESTYFRKYEASLGDERREWGLCGGSFFPSGQLRPEVTSTVIECMRRKGFETINDYYLEEHVGFIRKDNLEDYYIGSDVLEACGMHWLSDESTFCKTYGYIPRRSLPSFVNCMARNGYELTLPRYKLGFRVVDDPPPDRNFCMVLTPRNQKGGVSLGNARTN